MKRLDPALIRRLQTNGRDPNRTRAKALVYYGAFDAQRRATLDKMIREALATDDWSELKEHMRGWW